MLCTNPSDEPLRILLVEDDEFDVAVFRRAFLRSQIPCKILRCSRAEEALTALREAKVDLDLLVADHHLPGITGLELCRALLDKNAPFALALLTGGGSEQIAIKALKAGVQEYIVKDSNPEFLEILPLVLRQVAWRHRDQLARQLAEDDARLSRDRAADYLHRELREMIEGDLGASLHELEVGIDSLLGDDLSAASARKTRDLKFILSRLQACIEGLPGLMRQSASGLQTSQEPSDPASASSAQSPDEPSADADASRPAQVLIVQDNPVVASLTATYVENLGLRYVPVGDGRQALEALEREPFDLVLMDIQLPGLDGLEACQQLRRDEEANGGRHLPVLGVPVDLERGEGESCLRAGMDGFVARPVTFEKLGREIRRLLPGGDLAASSSPEA